MYVCKFETEKNIKQMELTDYFGKPRTVEFDMNNPDDIKKAIQVLAPKTRKKTPRRKKGQTENETNLDSSIKGAKYQDVLQLIPHIKTTNKTAQKRIETKPKIAKPKKTIKSSKKVIHSKVKDLHTEIPERPIEVELSEPIISTPTPAKASLSEVKVPQTQIPKSNTKPISASSSVATSKTTKPPAKQSPIPTPSNISPHIPTTPTSPKQSIPLFLSPSKTPLSKTTDSPTSIKLPDHFLSALGIGGELEIPCPLCSEINNFELNDINHSTPIATRQCDNCGTFLRISIRSFNQTIFRDLKLQPDVIQRHLTKKLTEVQDEEHNSIYIYSLQISQLFKR
jgi:hypothetical protein